MMPLPEMTLQNPGNLPKIVKFTHNACIMDITETCCKYLIFYSSRTQIDVLLNIFLLTSLHTSFTLA